MSARELDAIGRRIERLTLAPEQISAPFTRLFRPLLYRIGKAPRASVAGLLGLVERVHGQAPEEGADASIEVPEPEAHLASAVRELERNLRRVERATIVLGRPLTAYAAWLRRTYEVIVRAERVIRSEALPAARFGASTDPTALLPPLALRGAMVIGEDEDEAPGDAGDGAGAVRRDPMRVVELQLGAIDHLLAAAREEDALLARRRRLLEAARQLLLETAGALELDADGVQQRLRSIAMQVTRIDRMEAMGLRGDVSLMHQARAALSRGERDRLFASLQAIDEAARLRGDAAVSARTSAAIARMFGHGPGSAGAGALEEASLRSIAQSAREMFGRSVVEAIEEGYRRARAGREDWFGDGPGAQTLAREFARYVAPGAERSMMAAALSVDGCFELGGAMSPVRVEEEFVRLTRVPFPTQDLLLVPAEGPEDVRDAVIQDPRAVLLDLAAGRLLARRYVRREIETRTRTRLRGEVRVYVLDGSSSMLGPRARMRDAILVAELATLMRRMANQARAARVVLFYRYFNSRLGPVHRVDTPGGALQAIHEVLSQPRTGATDIEGALLASLEQVREAREQDPELGRAQIVLVTDGEAPVDEARIVAARAGIGDLPVGVSVVALGEENLALRQLVARQRALGERAFYHFVPDEVLEAMALGRIDGGLPLHLPPVAARHAGMADELTEIVEEIAALERGRQGDALRSLDQAERSRRVAVAEAGDGSDAGDAMQGEGARASVEALHRDQRALAQRFARWFPEPVRAPAGPAAPPPEQDTLERDDLESVILVLGSIVEIVELIESTELGRQADAIDLLERTLPDARLSPARYHAILRAYPQVVAPALEAVRAAVRWGMWRRIEKPQTMRPVMVPRPLV